MHNARVKVPFFKKKKRDLEEEVAALRHEIDVLRRKSAAIPGKNHEVLLVLARALRDSASIEEFADAAIAAVIAELKASQGAVIVEKQGELAVLAARTAKRALAPAQFNWSRAIATGAAVEGTVVATHTASEDKRFKASASVMRYGLESVLALPLLRGMERAGCLYLQAPPGGFAPLEATALLAMADLISVAISRLESEKETTRRAKLEAIGLAAAEIAHDLRSPLATAEFALGLLKPGSDGDAKAVVRLKGALARAKELSTGLVGLATGRARAPDLARQKVAPVIEEHARAVEEELRSSEISLEKTLDPEVEAVFERSALLRILENLTRNAQRAMPEGGHIELRCGPAGPGEAELSLADTGPGIPPERLATIFQLGDEPDSSTGLRTRGGGLGLVLIQELIVAMGGSIQASSEPGKGTRFTIRLRSEALAPREQR